MGYRPPAMPPPPPLRPQRAVKGGLIGRAGVEPCQVHDFRSKTPALDLVAVILLSGLIAWCLEWLRSW